MAEENEGVAAEQDLDAIVDELVEGLSSSSRRRRQEVSHELATYAKSDPDKVAGHIAELVDALYRPEAQTRGRSSTRSPRSSPRTPRTSILRSMAPRRRSSTMIRSR